MNQLSASELLARAAWLVDGALLDGYDEPEGSLVVPLGQLRAVCADDVAASRAACAWDEQVLRVGLGASLLAALSDLCHAAFEMRQGLPSLRGGRTPVDVARLIDLDSLAPLHPDLLFLRSQDASWCRRADADDSDVTAALAGGSVDTHVHLGGAVPPAFHWIALMSGLLAFGVVSGLPQIDGPASSERRERWVREGARAARLRMGLARALLEAGDQRARQALRHLPDSSDPVWRSLDEEPGVLATLNALARLRRAAGYALGARREPARLQDLLLPPAAAAEHARADEAGENRLLQLVGLHLREAHGHGSLGDPVPRRLAQGLFAYLRLRQAFYRAWRHDHGRYGLLRFGENAKRQSLLANRRRGRWQDRRRQRQRREFLRFERQRLAQAVAAQLFQCFEQSERPGSRPARALELRVSLWAGSSAVHRVRAWMQGLGDAFELAQGLPGTEAELPPFQVGLVVHALKGADVSAEGAARQARPLQQLLRSFPELRRLFVGFDAANRERDTPPRVFARAFGELRELQARYRARAGEPLLRLGFTYHAGEDPWDLLTGLRHMDEAFDLLLERHGRIGHGLALGDDVRAFYARRRHCEPTLGAHLLDLVWAWGRLRETADGALAVRCEHLLSQHAGVHCGTSGPRLDACWRGMGLADLGLRHGATILQETELLERLGFAGNAQQPVDVRVDEPWVTLVESLQRVLRRRFAQAGATIEANPTSNLLIGDYASYAALPYRTLTAAELRVSLNTDNPGMFATTLPTEFQRVKAGLVEAGLSPRVAGDWLAERARDALASTFLTTATPCGHELLTWARRHTRGLGHAPPTD